MKQPRTSTPEGSAAAAPRTPRTKSPDEALAALMRLCARAERSTGDALRLMQRWGLSEGDRQQVLQRLVRDRFIDDARYAEAFVRDKLRLSGWGEYKIRAALLRKGIARATIDAALCQTDREAMGRRLEEQLRREVGAVSEVVEVLRSGISADLLVHTGPSLAGVAVMGC